MSVGSLISFIKAGNLGRMMESTTDRQKELVMINDSDETSEQDEPQSPTTLLDSQRLLESTGRSSQKSRSPRKDKNSSPRLSGNNWKKAHLSNSQKKANANKIIVGSNQLEGSSPRGSQSPKMAKSPVGKKSKILPTLAANSQISPKAANARLTMVK